MLILLFRISQCFVTCIRRLISTAIVASDCQTTRNESQPRTGVGDVGCKTLNAAMSHIDEFSKKSLRSWVSLPFRLNQLLQRCRCHSAGLGFHHCLLSPVSGRQTQSSMLFGNLQEQPEVVKECLETISFKTWGGWRTKQTLTSFASWRGRGLAGSS